MGSGKTTLGRALPRRMAERGFAAAEFIDLDEAVEETAGMSVPEIFRTLGEAAFRELESRTLQSLTRRKNVIVACGGGTPCRKENMSIMNRCGITVWLRAGTDTLVRRLMEAPSGQRPLLNGKDTPGAVRALVVEMMEKRTPHYSACQLTLDSNRLESEGEIRDTADALIDILANIQSLSHISV